MEKIFIEFLHDVRQALKQYILQKKLKFSNATTTIDPSLSSDEESTLMRKKSKMARWYHGGLASAGAACFTHPLDTMKVYYQTSGALGQIKSKQQSLVSATVRVVHANGLLSLYNGLTASVLRQLTYSTTRFAIYELSKQKLLANTGNTKLPLYQLSLIAAVSGAIGGFVGTPTDVLNVRMQNDIKLPPNLKRNYRNVVHGFTDIVSKEGYRALFQGSLMVVSRATLISVGQLAMYDQYKHWLVSYLSMSNDQIRTHLVSSFFTSITCTAITQPLDVMKTRMMNQSHESRQNILECSQQLLRKHGIAGFFKGFVPALLRLAPHTIIVYILFEQLRIHQGIEIVEDKRQMR